jgi:serine/threonine protein kinase
MSNTAVGSYRYMSPERLRGEKYDAAGDIWSVGISVIELWEKAYPFLNIADTPISLLGELERVSFSRILSRSRVGYSKQLKDFLLLTLEPDPAKRLGAADLMSAEWFEVTGVVSLPDAQNVRSYVWTTTSRGKVCFSYALCALLRRWWRSGWHRSIAAPSAAPTTVWDRADCTRSLATYPGRRSTQLDARRAKTRTR